MYCKQQRTVTSAVSKTEVGTVLRIWNTGLYVHDMNKQRIAWFGVLKTHQQLYACLYRIKYDDTVSSSLCLLNLP